MQVYHMAVMGFLAPTYVETLAGPCSVVVNMLMIV